MNNHLARAGLLCRALLLFLVSGCGGVVEETSHDAGPAQPECVDIPDVQTHGRCLRVVTNDSAAWLSLHGSDLYYAQLWSEQAPIQRVPTAGGDPVTLGNMKGLAVPVITDGANLYWSEMDNGALMKEPIGGGTATELLGSLPSQAAIAVDESNIYWTENVTQDLSRMPKGGGEPIVLVSGHSPLYPIVFQGYVYFEETEPNIAISRVPAQGGAVEAIASDSNNGFGGIAVHTTGVYWANSIDGTLNRVPLAGGERTILATWPEDDVIEGGWVKVDDAAVYWSVGGVLRKLPHDGGAFEEIARDDALEFGFEIDASAIYWSRGPSHDGIVALSPK
jgi:hypothetical protein